MKHFLIKFNHGVEIGAILAYTGHYDRTNDVKILNVIRDEWDHRWTLDFLLAPRKSSKVIDGIFSCIGHLIKWACKFCPLSWLNWVASTMEVFAVFSYTDLAKKYPAWSDCFIKMAETEAKHRDYFRKANQ